MNVCGIITEYNPFHNGHQYHLDQARQLTQADLIINVMSTNFVQRGEPAIINKWERAQQAIEAGCDIVIELPTIYATQAAYKFALGAIELLKLAKVHSIVFGSESNDLKTLQHLSTIHVPLDKEKSTNQSFQAIRGLHKSNDILGINYLKALQGTSIIPYTIQRTNNYQDEHLAPIASASAIRKAVFEHQPYAFATPMHQLSDCHQMKHYYPYLRNLLLSLSASYLSTLFLMDEGIERHLYKQAMHASDYDTFLQHAITKKYPKTRIQRTLIQLLLQVSKSDAHQLEQLNFIRILAFNDKGRAYLKQIKDEVNIVTRWKDLPKIHQDLELKATCMYASILDEPTRLAYIKKEVQPPIYVK